MYSCYKIIKRNNKWRAFNLDTSDVLATANSEQLLKDLMEKLQVAFENGVSYGTSCEKLRIRERLGL